MGPAAHAVVEESGRALDAHVRIRIALVSALMRCISCCEPRAAFTMSSCTRLPPEPEMRCAYRPPIGYDGSSAR